MARKIIITSGKGGVGKTSICAFLGYEISRFGERVMLVDLDFGLNNLDMVCGVEDKVTFDIKDAVLGKCRVKQTIIELTPNLSMIPSFNGFDKRITGQNVKCLLEGLTSKYDYLLIDSPAGIDEGFLRGVSLVDEGIVVVTPTLSSVRDADKVIHLLKSFELKNIFVIVNMARGDLMVKGESLTILEIQNLLKTEIIGVIPQEDNIILSNRYELDSCLGKRAIKLCARSLVKGKIRLFDPTSRYKGLFGKLRIKLRSAI